MTCYKPLDLGFTLATLVFALGADMTLPKVRAVPPPPSSAIAGWYSQAHLLDSYAIELLLDTPRDARLLAKRILLTQPAPVRLLLAVRDAVMAKMGVATTADISRAMKGRDRIGFFPVISSTPAEIVVGYDDSHLDFRTSIAIIGEPNGDVLVATTAVRCHNMVGRLYLFAIKPFHVAIVKAGLRRAQLRK